MRTSFHTSFLSTLPVTDAVRYVRDYGYDEVELNAETLPSAEPHVTPQTDAATRRELSKLGPYSALSAHRLDLSDSSDEVRSAGVEWTIAMMQLATDVGIEFVHVIPGTGPNLPGLYVALRQIVHAADGLGITVGFEAIVNQSVCDADGLDDVIKAVPGLRVNFDPSHLQVHDGDVVRSATRYASLIDHVAIKDARGIPSDFVFPAPGEGEVDFVEMLFALRNHGYDGALSVEYEAQLFGDNRSPSEVLPASLTFIHGLVAQVDRRLAEQEKGRKR